MKRKGVSDTVALAIVSFVMVGVIVTIGAGNMINLEENIKLRTVDIPAQRMATTMTMVDTLDQAQVQLSMQGRYGLEIRSDGPYLNYTSDGYTSADSSSGSSKIDSGIDFTAEEGISDTFCVIKESGENPDISPGGCP